MSPLWRDSYVAVLTPDQVALVRRRRGWDTPLDLKLAAPCPGPEALAATLGELLNRPEVGRGELTLLLSNHFVRYLLVPWQDEVRDPGEFAAFAGICCDQVYGGDSAGRRLRTSREKVGSPRLAATLDTAFLAALEEVAAASRLHLASVQPYLAAAFNRLGNPFRRGDFLFVLAEPRRTCILLALNRRWSSIRAATGEDSPQALADLIERESRLLGLEAATMPPVYIHAPRWAQTALPECNGARPQTLTLPIPAALADGADSLLTMAMAAI